MRNLVLVLGDQLDRNSAAFDGFDPAVDAVWMAEVREEATHAWSHKVRIALFLSAMRHFAAELRAAGIQVIYRRMDDPANHGSFAAELAETLEHLRPAKVIVVEPGEWRVAESLRPFAEFRPDRHFYCSREEFGEWAHAKKQLRLEFFYRHLRAQHQVLMERGEPVGGRWNFDAENRGSLGKGGPRFLPQPITFAPDAITCEVVAMANKIFADHPGTLDNFDFPVTAADARRALDDFISNSLPFFGRYQDAMWTDEPVLYHSRLSALMNLKLLNPRDAVIAAEQAFHDGHAPIEAVEGYIRQILGWREYVRGIYWRFMPEYLDRNHLDAHEPLPWFYWNGKTDMECMRQALGQTLRYGYAHHIQRLMVTGLFALLFGVEPKQIHLWYLAIYYDAVEWVELPNTLGLSQYGDGGVMGSKPYIASGKYIQRMSNYCGHCRYDPAKSTGETACPFTTLYWDFLMRHETMLRANPRTLLQIRNVDRLSASEKSRIKAQAADLRSTMASRTT
jgi:deoxyribodipyrimidine photolyase-related protein